LRRHLLARRYAAELFAAVEPDLKADVLESYKAQSINATVTFAAFKASDYLSALDYTQDDLRAYLSEHRGEFALADMMIFKRDIYADVIKAEITDEQVKARYEADIEDYRNPERRDYRRILIPLNPDASEEDKAKARATIAAIYDRLQRPGEDFATVARDYSKDTAATSEESLIEGQSKDDIADEALANAVFDLKEPGEYNTEAAETSSGLEIIQLVKIHPAGVTPLDEVREEILDKLACWPRQPTATGPSWPNRNTSNTGRTLSPSRAKTRSSLRQAPAA